MEKKYLTYEQFGAIGDGSHDDLEAIVATHAEANEKGLAVKARDGAVYYIGGAKKTAVIKTDVDFGQARFIIDDRELEDIAVVSPSRLELVAIITSFTSPFNRCKSSFNLISFGPTPIMGEIAP